MDFLLGFDDVVDLVFFEEDIEGGFEALEGHFSHFYVLFGEEIYEFVGCFEDKIVPD